MPDRVLPARGAGNTTIDIRHLSFNYRRSPALIDVSAQLMPGVTGLLGPNGAGKTTLLGCIATVLKVRPGTVEIEGNDTAMRRGRYEARRLIGYLPQRFDLVGSLRAVDTVAYAAWASGVDDADCDDAAMRALSLVDLADKARLKVRELSGGQRQRLGIAAALAHEPKILLLDEPTVGLDPDSRVKVRQHIASIGNSRTVVVSTHMIEDVVRMTDRILVLNAARLVFDGNTDAMATQGNRQANALISPLEAGYQHLLEAQHP